MLVNSRGTRLAAAVVLLLLPAARGAADSLAVVGIPRSSVGSTPATAERRELDEAAQAEFQLRISKRDGEYLWETREGRRLDYVRAGGAAHVFTDPMGGGVVKIIDLRGIPKSVREAVAYGAKGDIVYFESISQGMLTITYFGEVVKFEP